jgi:hypothetical protein
MSVKSTVTTLFSPAPCRLGRPSRANPNFTSIHRLPRWTSLQKRRVVLHTSCRPGQRYDNPGPKQVRRLQRFQQPVLIARPRSTNPRLTLVGRQCYKIGFKPSCTLTHISAATVLPLMWLLTLWIRLSYLANPSRPLLSCVIRRCVLSANQSRIY